MREQLSGKNNLSFIQPKLHLNMLLLQTICAIIITTPFLSPPIFADTPILHLGHCALTSPRTSERKQLAVCLQGSAKAHALRNLNRDLSFAIRSIDLYAGLHSNKHSFHLRTETLNIQTFIKKEAPKANVSNKLTLAAYQYGKTGLAPFKATVGFFPLPFSTGFYLLREIYPLFASPEIFWPNPSPSASLTLDDGETWTFDFGISKDKDTTTNAASIRLSRDFSAMSGTRLIASAFGTRSIRRYGLSLLNIQHQKKFFLIEWIRSHTMFPIKTHPFEQLFRIVFQQQNKNVISTFMFDDIRKRAHIATYDYLINWKPYFGTGFFVLYQKMETPFERVNWYLGARCTLRL